MPEDQKEETKDIQAEPLQETRSDEEKRRIRPVIEEVAPEAGESNVEEVKEEKEEVSSLEQKEDVSAVPNYETRPESVSSESKSDIKLFVLVAVITAIVVAALAGGIYVYITGTKNTNSNVSQTPEPTPVVEATTEPSPEGSPSGTVKLTDYKVQILNGSGKIGEAGSAKTLVEKAGFKVGNTGNAATFDFTDTIIQIKSSVSSDVLAKLKDSLSSAYSIKVGDNLDSTSGYDILITVGSK